LTTYAYDATDAMDYQLGANGLTRDYRYNVLGRLIGLDHFNDTNGNRRNDTGEALTARFEYT
jgi:hypothetical protein